MLVTGKSPDKVAACATCHGLDLGRMDATPSISGRLPRCVLRQRYELQAGIRTFQNAALMKAAVDKRSVDDMISIAAYLTAHEP